MTKLIPLFFLMALSTSAFANVDKDDNVVDACWARAVNAASDPSGELVVAIKDPNSPTFTIKIGRNVQGRPTQPQVFNRVKKIGAGHYWATVNGVEVDFELNTGVITGLGQTRLSTNNGDKICFTPVPQGDAIF